MTEVRIFTGDDSMVDLTEVGREYSGEEYVMAGDGVAVPAWLPEDVRSALYAELDELSVDDVDWDDNIHAPDRVGTLTDIAGIDVVTIHEYRVPS